MTRAPGRGLHRALAWRRRGWLFRAYKRLPAWLRSGVSRMAWKRLWGGLKFPALPAMAGPPMATPLARQSPSGAASLNLFGYFAGQLGLGESARLYATALDSLGVQLAPIDVDLGLLHARQDAMTGAQPNPTREATDLVMVNPDHFGETLPMIQSLGHDRRFRVGCWHWELERLPPTWRQAIEHVDAIMVASGFVEDAFSVATNKPVFRVPLPFVLGEDSGAGRDAFGLSATAFVFLASFDFHSSVHRKNPRDVIAAFAKAFPDTGDDVQLIVKSANGNHYPEQLAELVEAAGDDPRILVRDQSLDMRHMRALQRCCDAYISLHRAEGFGLGMAECMGMGKPVVATAWSGNMEYMRPDNSCLVDAELVPIASHEYPDSVGARWAQPDIGQAAQWMRRLVFEEGLATRIGKRAEDDIRDLLSPSRVGGLLLAGLQAARCTHDRGTTTPAVVP